MAGTPPTPPEGSSQPVKQFRSTWGNRLATKISSPLARLGLVPRTYLLTTKGRKTGRPHSNPATIVDMDGKRWLVAPYGVVSWVHNVRADNRVTLRRGSDTSEYTVREVSSEEAGPVLKRYVEIAPVPRPYFRSSVDSPVEDFIAEADHHPVFELTPSEVRR